MDNCYYNKNIKLVEEQRKLVNKNYIQLTLSNIDHTGPANFVDICEDGYHRGWVSWLGLGF